MNVSRVSIKDYEDKTLGQRGKNKPNSNPIQTQSNPIKANKMPKQTQFKPKQTQFVVSLSNLFQRMHNHKGMNIEVEDPAFRGRNQSSTGPFVVSLCQVSRESISIRNSFAAKKYTAPDMIFIIFVFIIFPFSPIRSRFFNYCITVLTIDDTKNGKSFDRKRVICDYILQFDLILLSEPFGAVLV